MSNHSITVVVDHRLNGMELDALFEAGADDTAPELRGDRTTIHFDRDAATLADALQTALADITRAGLQVIAVQAGDIAAS